MAKTFSIALCTYNGARYLRDQLDSIAAQTRPPDELVVCDDASTDDTLRIVSNFASSVPFAVHLHSSDENRGSTKNFERAIGLCHGDYIALSDQDDVWLPVKLATIEQEFARRPNTGLIFTDADVIDDAGLLAGYTIWEKLPVSVAERRRLRSRGALNELMAGATVTGATMAFRGQFKELILPIPADLAIIHDAWIALMIAAVSEILPLDLRLIRYRQHSLQQVGAQERKLAPSGVRNALQRVNSYAELIEISSRARQRLSENGAAYSSHQAITQLQARLTHLHNRAGLPGELLSRTRCILGELWSRRYHLYSNGLRSAVKDLLG